MMIILSGDHLSGLTVGGTEGLHCLFQVAQEERISRSGTEFLTELLPTSLLQLPGKGFCDEGTLRGSLPLVNQGFDLRYQLSRQRESDFPFLTSYRCHIQLPPSQYCNSSWSHRQACGWQRS